MRIDRWPGRREDSAEEPDGRTQREGSVKRQREPKVRGWRVRTEREHFVKMCQRFGDGMLQENDRWVTHIHAHTHAHTPGSTQADLHSHDGKIIQKLLSGAAQNWLSCFRQNQTEMS